MSARNPLFRQPSGVQRQPRSELDMRTTGMLQSRRSLAYEVLILQVIASGLCACGKPKKAEIEVRATDRLARQRKAGPMQLNRARLKSQAVDHAGQV